MAKKGGNPRGFAGWAHGHETERGKTREAFKKRKGGTFIQRSRSKTPSEKAAFHQIDGAGRSRVKRPFFELDRADEEAIVRRIQDGLDQQLKESR